MEQGNIFLNTQPIKASLDLPTIDPNSIYVVDWSKMTSVNDMVLVLASMGVAFPGNHPNIQALAPFLNLDKPVSVQQQPQQPQGKEIKLPKLKPVK